MEYRNDIQDRMMSNMPNTYDKSVGGHFWNIQMPLAIELEGINVTNENTLNNAFFETADLEHKKKIARDRAQIEMKAATYAHGIVKITGEVGAKVAKGILVASDNLTFTVEEEKNIGSDGTVEVEVTCTTSGEIGNIPTGAIKTFPVTIDRLFTVTNEQAFSNGYAEESLEDFSARYYNKIRTPATSGNVYHYQNWALEVSGVGGVRVNKRTPKRGSVTLTIIDANKQPADEELVQAVQEHVEEEMPCLVDLYVNAAQEVKVDVSVKIVTQLKENDFKNLITQKIDEYLRELAFSRDVASVSYARIGERILDIEGIEDYTDLTVNGGTSNIAIEYNSVATMGEVTLIE